MAECISEYPSNFTFDFCQTRKTLPRSFRKSTDISEELFGTQNNNYFIHAELDYFDRILQEHYKEPTTRSLSETKDHITLDNNCLSGLQATKKPQLDLRQVSDQLLQKLQEKRVNLVLVATSLDENDVVQKLSGSLDPQTSSMIPLSFDENKKSVKQLNFGSGTQKREGNVNTKNRVNKHKDEIKHKCASEAQQKDEKYWKRRTSNNEAARRSREAKRSRFIWIQKRTKELEIENVRLQKELQSLEKKVLEL